MSRFQILSLFLLYRYFVAWYQFSVWSSCFCGLWLSKRSLLELAMEFCWLQWTLVKPLVFKSFEPWTSSHLCGVWETVVFPIQLESELLMVTITSDRPGKNQPQLGDGLEEWLGEGVNGLWLMIWLFIEPGFSGVWWLGVGRPGDRVQEHWESKNVRQFCDGQLTCTAGHLCGFGRAWSLLMMPTPEIISVISTCNVNTSYKTITIIVKTMWLL